jgi:F-type H+-transporting ATPase subunit delta
MSDNISAQQHAKEIFKTALESNELNRWQSDLRKLANLARDATLVSLLENPEVSFDEKAKELAGRLGEATPEVIRFVSEYIGKGKLSEMEDISYEYQKLVDNHRGIEGTETAEITTAIPLDDEYTLNIAKRLTSMVGKPVVVNTRVDPELVGGIIIKVGDKVIDGSIRSKLATLRREMGRSA